MRTTTLTLVILLGAVATAQEASAPTLSTESRLTLQVLDVTAENLQLRLALVNAERAQLLATLTREGYTLQRGPNGWAYTPLVAKESGQ